MLMQLGGSIPYVANLIATQIDFAIGYLHWTFLGVVSLAILGFLNYFGFINLSKHTYHLYLLGFITTEGFIFYKGITQWLQEPIIKNYYLYLAVVSLVFLLAIGLLLFEQLRSKKATNN